MNIPLDNLYHWVESLLPAPACVYVFHPHGSKNILDLIWLKNYDVTSKWKFPGVIAHDQEPLDWNLYNCPEQYLDVDLWKNNYQPKKFYDICFTYLPYFNLKTVVFALSGVTYDQAILIHSEKNSTDLEKYQENGFICVHYWAHAVIARDWYRFAEYDTRLHTDTKPQHKFLIYCRDWSHRREYRLKFLEMLVQHNLHSVSQTSVMHTNSENIHFSQHRFLTPEFELIEPELINQISTNSVSSCASADYDPADFVNSEISVVLETIFDGDRIHLTEKILRPIACGHPFILAAGPGSLEYIRSYGFKTFAPWIDESYDQETDSLKRLEKIIQSMEHIQQLQGSELENFSKRIKQIADFNKTHFFSDNFFNSVKSELKNNLDCAYSQVGKVRGKYYLELLKILKKNNEFGNFQYRREKTQFLRQLRRSYPRDQSNP
jgi:hypothetical protein